MIDTVKLAIPCTDVNITDYSAFDVNPEVLKDKQNELSAINGYMSCTRTNSKQEKQDYGYLPQIGVCSFPNQDGYITIRFSVPKLIFGDNLHEPEETDFSTVITVLQTKLKLLDIHVDASAIEDASIWEIHVGKNIDLTGKIECRPILSVLNKLNYDKRLKVGNTTYWHDDLNKTIYQNDGEKFSLYCKGYELCLYDKLAEIGQDEYGIKFVQDLSNDGINEVLRMEYRMFKSKYVKQEFEKCGFQRTQTFKSIFQKSFVKAMNLNVWDRLIAPKLEPLAVFEEDPLVLISKMKQVGITGISQLKILGAYNIYHSENGMNTLKQIFPSRTNVIPRILKDVNKIQKLNGCGLQDGFKYIRDTLEQNQSL